ncbi:MAG: thioesterase family protein [Mogibacterium sp.]|nr:thioesterase family protein [Mogibacterium sp.]
MELAKGIKNRKEEAVTSDLTAEIVGSGGLSVYATPCMIRLMEHTAWESVESCMEEGFTTVGILMNVKHVSASPLGAKICCETELSEIDGRRLVFKVAAYDDKELIGEGIHERFIVNAEKFMSKISG